MEEKLELQAVILAGGPGTKLAPFSEGTPKSMLPIANKPMIYYQLVLLEQAGFKEVIVITNQSASSKMRKYVLELFKGQIHVVLEVVSDETNSADALRSVKDLIKSDFVVISGDLITDVSISRMANVHRTYHPTLTALIKENPEKDPKASGASSTKMKGTVPEFIGLDEKRKRLLFINTNSQIAKDELIIPKTSLICRPPMSISTRFTDAHLYIFSKWVIDLITEMEDSIHNIKTDLVPLLIDMQFMKLSAKLGISENLLQRIQDHLTSDIPTDYNLIGGISTTKSESTSEESELTLAEDSVKCFVYLIASTEQTYCQRANTLTSYMEVNRDIAAGVVRLFDIPRTHTPYAVVDSATSAEGVAAAPASTPTAAGATAIGPATAAATTSAAAASGAAAKQPAGKLQIGADSVVGVGLQVADRVSIKKGVIGNHCKLGAGGKIQNTIMMDHVSVGERCTLNNCIIGNNVTIPDDTQLQNCYVAHQFTVAAGDHKNETFKIQDDAFGR